MGTFYATFLNELFLDLKHATSVCVFEQPFFKMYRLTKRGGRAIHQRFVLTGSRANSGSFAGAQAVAGTGGARANVFEWEVPTGELFGTVRVSNTDVELSDSNEDAAARAAQFELEVGQKEFAQMFCRKMLGAAGAKLGEAEFEETASGDFPAFCLRFEDPENVKWLAPGDHVVITASTDDGTDSGDTQVGSVGYVIAVDFENGYAQVAATTDPSTAANPGSWVDDTTYSVYRLGELDAGDLTGQLTSWAAYITSVKATNTLCGVNRSLHSALSGVRLPSSDPAASGSLVGRVKRHLAVMANRAGQTHKAMCLFNPEDFDIATSQLETQVRREPEKDAETGYMHVLVNSALGPVKFVSEPSQPKGEYLIVNPDMLELQTSNGEIYSPVIPPGGTAWQLLEGSNTFEARVVSLNRHYVGVPYHHGRGSTL